MRFSLGIILAVLAQVALGGCGVPDPVDTYVRDDVELTTYTTTFTNGRSGQIAIDVPFGTESLLIEVRGSRGRYSIAELIDPDNRNVVEGGGFQTRSAGGTPGYIQWLYPNSPDLRLKGGENNQYLLTLSAVDLYTCTRNQNDVETCDNLNGEEVKVRVYKTDAKPEATCGVRLDLLFAVDALRTEDFIEASDDILEDVSRILRQVGIKLLETNIRQIEMQSSEIRLEDKSATRVVGKVLRSSQSALVVRSKALQVFFVRKVFGEETDSNPLGFSMGLPGPYSSDADTSAVLVSTELFTQGGNLNVNDLASTLTHELGHYLGLYHTSEKDLERHDPLDDTPECSSSTSCSDDFKRNVMTQSRFLGSKPSEYRNRFSPSQGAVMRRHPLCEPMDVDIILPPVDECTLQCNAPDTCAVLDGQMACEPACDPEAAEPCSSGQCEPDQLGTLVCQ